VSSFRRGGFLGIARKTCGERRPAAPRASAGTSISERTVTQPSASGPILTVFTTCMRANSLTKSRTQISVTLRIFREGCQPYSIGDLAWPSLPHGKPCRNLHLLRLRSAQRREASQVERAKRIAKFLLRHGRQHHHAAHLPPPSPAAAFHRHQYHPTTSPPCAAPARPSGICASSKDSSKSSVLEIRTLSSEPTPKPQNPI